MGRSQWQWMEEGLMGNITPAQELLNEKALRASPEDLLGPLSTLSSSYWRHLRANGPQQ